MRFLFRLAVLTVVVVMGLALLGHIAAPSSSSCLSGVEKASSSLVSATSKSTASSATKPSVLSDVARGGKDAANVVRYTYRFVYDLFHHHSVVADAKNDASSAIGAGQAAGQVAKSVVDQPGVKNAGHRFVTATTSCLTHSSTAAAKS
jgi:hypothetical protein